MADEENTHIGKIDGSAEKDQPDSSEKTEKSANASASGNIQIPPQSAPVATDPSPAKAIPPKPGITDSPARKAKQDRPPSRDPGIWRMNRRNFFNVAGWMAFLTFIVTSTIATLRYMFPRVLFEPPTKFKIGFPGDFVVGEVSERFKDEHRVWIVREKEGFYALIAICTHLGCTPNWMATEDKFKCPCHGSGYYRNGVNFEGPTPRPLERAYIDFGDDGQLLVDTSVTYRYEKGEWISPGAFCAYRGA